MRKQSKPKARLVWPSADYDPYDNDNQPFAEDIAETVDEWWYPAGKKVNEKTE